jgi:hypothetical protein
MQSPYDQDIAWNIKTFLYITITDLLLDDR